MDHVTLTTGVMAAENSALSSWNKLHCKIYKNTKYVLKIVTIFHNISVFTVFSEQINAPLHNLTDPIHLNGGRSA